MHANQHFPLRFSRRDILVILALFLITRLLLVGVGAVTVTTIPSTEGAEYTHLLDGGAVLDMWYRWDAGFYASIATYGYDWVNERRAADDLAFLPLYPALVSIAGGMTERGCLLSPYLSTCATIGGVIVSNLALLASAFLLYDLARRRFDDGTGLRAIFLLLITPNLIFLSGVYTEGLFLFLCLLTFWALEQDKRTNGVGMWFGLAVGTACLACLTRSVGVALYPALLWVAWTRKTPMRGLRLVLSHLPLMTFGGYVLFAGVYVGDPLAYLRAYSGTWGRARSSPIEAFTVYFSGEQVSLFGWRLSWIDLIATLAYLLLAFFTLRYDRAWGLFTLAAILIPIATGWLLSMPRFGAPLFPFYILIAAWANRPYKAAPVYAASAALALLFITRFVTWRWIA